MFPASADAWRIEVNAAGLVTARRAVRANILAVGVTQVNAAMQWWKKLERLIDFRFRIAATGIAVALPRLFVDIRSAATLSLSRPLQ